MKIHTNDIRRKTLRNAKMSCIWMFTASMVCTASAQLDFFGAPNQDLNFNGMPVGSTMVDAQTTTLGGATTVRTLTGTLTNVVNPVAANAYLYEGVLGMGQGGGEGCDLSLEWGGGTDMNLNLLAYGSDFTFSHWSNDGVAGSSVSITVWNGTESFTSPLTFLSNTSFGPPDNFTYTVPFSAFGSADFGDIDRISFNLKCATSADIEVANFQVIPEPCIMQLAFISALVWIRRRRK